VVSVFFAAALVLIQIAPWVSSYKVIVWVGTVLVSFAVFALPHLWAAAGWLVGARTAPRGLWVRAARPAIIGVGVLAGNGQRGTYEVFVALAVSTIDIRQYPPALRVSLSALWCAAAAYVFYGAYSAEFIRGALGLPG
jgi:hypothetical protein